MTNYERIKGMSVEEMAKNWSILFCRACKVKKPARCKKLKSRHGFFPCDECVLDWLNSEVVK